MAQIERMQTECPPDAHKVIRPPENEVKAILCMKLDSSEKELYGIEDFCSVLGLLGEKPAVFTEDAALRKEVEDNSAAAEIEPSWLKKDGDLAYFTYKDGAQGQALPFTDLTLNPEKAADFFDELGKKQFIIVDDLAMLILKSISTVYPWDKLLAGDFLRQYLKASSAISADDRKLLLDIRFGRVDAYSVKESRPEAYAYLRLERKLFLQYHVEDDD